MILVWKKIVYYIVCSLVRVGTNQPQPCPQYGSLQYRSPRWNRDIWQSRSRKGQSQGHPIRSLNMFRDYFLAISFFWVKKLNLQFKRKIEMCQNYNDVIMYCTHKFHYRYTIILFQPLLLSTLSKCLATWPRIDRVWVQIFLAVYELLWLSCINVCPVLVGWL